MEAFGDCLRRLRAAKGYSLAMLERESTYNRGFLSKLENGKRAASVDHARVLDRVLETGGELTRAVTIRPPVQEPLPDPDEEPWSFVLDPAGHTHYVPTAHAGVVGDGTLSATRIAPNTMVVDDSTVGLFETNFDNWRMMGHGMSGALVLPGLMAQYNALRVLLRTRAFPDLIRVASRFAEYTGWMFQEIGNVNMARAWTATAVRLATSAGDAGLGSYAWVRAAEIALYTGDGQTMVELASQAGAAPGATAAVRSLAAQRAAQGHALLGDPTACLSALDDAEHWRQIATAEAGLHYGTTSLPDPIAVARGWALHDLARSDESAILLSAELARIPPSAIRSRARFGVRLALAYTDIGDIDNACAQIATLLPDLKRTDSATVRVDLHHLVRLLAKHSGNPAVLDLRPEFRGLLHTRQ